MGRVVGEAFAKIRKAQVDRLAAQVNHLGLRKELPDHTDVLEVERPFFGNVVRFGTQARRQLEEMRCARCRVDAIRGERCIRIQIVGKRAV